MFPPIVSFVTIASAAALGEELTLSKVVVTLSFINGKQEESCSFLNNSQLMNSFAISDVVDPTCIRTTGRGQGLIAAN